MLCIARGALCIRRDDLLRYAPGPVQAGREGASL